MNSKFSQFTSALLVFFGCCFSASAVMVNWSSSFYGSHQDSNGHPIDARYTFELGAFAEGFVPSADNTEEWASQWIAADVATYDESTKNFASAADSQASAIPQGSRIFMWGFNERGNANGAEWVLLTSADWNWPGASSGSQNPALVWTVADANQSILGSLHSSGVELRTARISAGPKAVAPDAWIQQHFANEMNVPQVAGWSADPDNDGRGNLMEYAFGSDPNSVDASAAPSQEIVQKNGAHFIQIQVPHNPLSQTRIILEKSGDLQQWSLDDRSLRTIEESADLNSILFLSPVDPASAQSFRRVRVELLEAGAAKSGE